MVNDAMRPTLWTISASDSGGGAGLQADNRAAMALSVASANIVTSLTAQNSLGVQAVQSIDVSFLEQQWQTLQAEGWPQAIKIGWLPEQESILSWLVARLQQLRNEHPQVGIIWDPVVRATKGGLPMSRWHVRSLKTLLSLCDVITPNQDEVKQLLTLLQYPIEPALIDQVNALVSTGVGCVVVTGGDDTRSPSWVMDYVAVAADRWPQQPETTAVPRFRMTRPRLPYSCHGSGCHFSTAIAAYWAQGKRVYDALVLANAFMLQVLQARWPQISGYDNAFLVNVQTTRAEDLPSIESWHGSHTHATFAPADALGLYAIVDTLPQLQALLSLGVDTVQWRVKAPALDEEALAKAIDLCRDANVPLYINDHWQLAIRYQAYGVHLGQEDITSADLKAIAGAGLRLGISTHTEWEIARARSVQPSYIAVGPVHLPLSKQILYPPLGYEQLRQWHHRYQHERPLTCIGGIVPSNSAAVAATGMNSCAIVTSLQMDEALPERHQQLRRHFPKPLKTQQSVPTF